MGDHVPSDKCNIPSFKSQVPCPRYQLIWDLTLDTWHLNVVHLPDPLSNFRVIPDYLNIVDFIEEAEGEASG